MPVSDYPPPVDRLFDYASARTSSSPASWADYRQSLGLGPEHVPDLIRLVRDWPAHFGMQNDTLAVWAPVHAWRALGQLGAGEAVDALLETLTIMQAPDSADDWTLEEFPVVFGNIGPAVIPELEAYLADPRPSVYARSAAARGLVNIAKGHPDQRARIVEILRQAMSRFDAQDPGYNGFLLGYLLDLKAIEAVPVIREAFRAQKVDEMIAGGWVEVRKELNLERDPDDPPEISAADRWRERYPGWGALERAVKAPTADSDMPVLPGSRPQRATDKHKERAKAKRKQAKAARKQNRRRR